MEAPDFWNDPEVSQNKMKEVKSLKDDVATYAALSAQYDDIGTMIGIQDPHYLSIWFKKMMGLSVTEYRKCISEKTK